jgi:hypothetical protein
MGANFQPLPFQCRHEMPLNFSEEASNFRLIAANRHATSSGNSLLLAPITRVCSMHKSDHGTEAKDM